jgi:DNA processing protein
MTSDEAVALTYVTDLSRVGLRDRLQADDPELVELSRRFVDRAQTARLEAAGRGIHALAWSDPGFPSSLLTTSDCPAAVWYRGSLAALDGPAVAIVGSRAASAVALELARQLARDLAASGVAIVSGLARGADSAAHRGALESGRTIAVLGSGLDRVYPREHVPLVSEIAARGLVLSEYPPDAAPLPYRFPLRNRVISGLSHGVVVIEASEKSGSLITASCALQQGKEVMAVPGNVLSGRNRGGHALIRDGAAIVECAADVMDVLGWSGLRPPDSTGNSGSSTGESAICRSTLLKEMDPGQPYDLEALAGLASLPLPRLLPEISALELQGLINRVEGGRFVRRV